MNKMNKKGFTIVELVIVIAVIAILAGVLIPTFGGIIDRANESAEMQKVAAAYKEAYALALAGDGKISGTETCPKAVSGTDADITGCEVASAQGYKFYFKGTDCYVTDSDDVTTNTGYNAEYTYTFANGAWTAKKGS